MNSLKKIFYNGIVFTLLITSCLSCKDDEADQLRLQRMFKPAQFTINSGQTEAVVAWNPSLFTLPGQVDYVVEVSKDGTGFTNVEVSRTTTDPGIVISDTEIDIKTNYYARVKAVGRDGADDSNWLVSEPFSITGEILVQSMAESDVLADAAKIQWDASQVMTKIVITPLGGTAFEVVISGPEAAAGEKVVQGLTQNTTYTAEIFKGDVSKGSVTFKTKLSYAGSNIIDLRGITGKPKILVDTLPDIPSGSVVFLKRGQTYTIAATDPASARNFSKSVTIMSGPDFIPEFARIHTTTNFNFAANSTVDSVVFKDIIYKGVRPGGTSFDSDYIINVNAVTTVGTIKLENCTISRIRGTVRLQTGGAGAKVTNYIVNRCFLDSIRDFSVMHSGGASYFTNVRISNSTFSNCRKFATHAAAGNNSLVIENCTFNEVTSGGPAGAPVNWLIDFNTFGSATPVVLSNCIIGKSWVETAGNTDAGGKRSNVSTSINVTNTYVLSDFISTNPSFQIPGLLSYPGASTAVFTDPANGNFTIKDPAFPGTSSAGDPRWR